MKSIRYCFLLMLITISCTSEKENKKNIVGEWIFTEIKIENSIEEPPVPFLLDPPNIIFCADGTYINKNGFFKIPENDDRWENKTLYLGEKTKYKILEDSLSFLNPFTNKYEAAKVVKLTPDTLILKQKDKSLFTYVRHISKQYKNINIDKIVVSKASCYGTCPVNSTVIDNQGKLIFYGQRFNTQEGFFQAHLSKQITEDIFKELNTIGIEGLEKHYSINASDMASTTITFISNGKIVKTISDYGSRSPFELRRLIRNISYLYQHSDLKEMIIQDPILVGILQSKTQKVGLINDSESFYLYSELLNAQSTGNNAEKLPFTGNYQLDLPENIDYKKMDFYERLIYTDGRIFKIQLRDKTFKTLDLGYNFFKKNNLIEPRNYPKEVLPPNSPARFSK
ncbi:hypothetical protein SAMN05444360_102131 [Chryseobacterium carnipullorum]|nr:hypothetical protein SAMN05444360_102131 [Chryseobacterium carnipullorum]